MTGLFRGNKTSTHVISETELWERLEKERTSDAVFDAQGDEHSYIDMRLVEKIEGFLVPKIGKWELSDRWYHKLDFYGDGIRSLSFGWDSFQPEFVGALQGMLSGEHEPFCILCQFYEDFGSTADTRIGSMAIFSDRVLVSRPVAARLASVDAP